MSEKDRFVAKILSEQGEPVKVGDAREAAGMDSKLFGVYRDRLKKKGIIDTSKYGEISFSLPRFAEFVKEMPE